MFQMESGGDGPAIADGDGVIADSSNVIYLVEDIKPVVSNLSCEGVVQDCLEKREHQEELLSCNTNSSDVKIETYEEDITIKHENFDDYEKGIEFNFEASQTVVGRVNSQDFINSEQFEIFANEESGSATSNMKGVKNINSKKLFKCSYCDKEFSLKHHLVEHIRVHTGEKPFKCSYCDKAFSVSSTLNRHQRIHSGEKLFKCNYCDQAFISKSYLVLHVRIHTGEKPFKCSYCDKAFSRSSAHKTHQRVHTGEKPFKCEHCGMSFALKPSLVSHIRIHTGEKPFKCKYCEKAFSASSARVRHQRIHIREQQLKCS